MVKKVDTRPTDRRSSVILAASSGSAATNTPSPRLEMALPA